MKNRIVFNTWSGAFFNPGGGEVQLLNTREQLQRSGYVVSLYDQWSPQRDFDIFHQFSIQPGVEYSMGPYREMGKKVALSTILWVEYPKGGDGYHYIRKIFSLADILFTNSNMESAKLASAFDVDIEKFHKTINGVSEEYLNTQVNGDFREYFNIKGDFLVTVANIDRRKNTHSLVAACKKLGKKLVSIGHVRDESYFREFKSDYSGFVHLGPVSDKDLLKSAYQQAELFILPSLCETPGIAALEAASQGAKLVITQEGSTKEYFGDFAQYIDPLKLDSIISGIEDEIVNIRDKDKLASYVRDNFTWKNTVDQVIRGYESLYS